MKFGALIPCCDSFPQHILRSCMLREWRTDTEKSPNKDTNCCEISCVSVTNSVCSTYIITAFPKISLAERWCDVGISFFFIVYRGSFLGFFSFLSLRKCGQTIIHRIYCIWSLNQAIQHNFPTNNSSEKNDFFSFTKLVAHSGWSEIQRGLLFSALQQCIFQFIQDLN